MLAAMQDEHDDVVGLRARRAHAGDDHLAEVEPLGGLGNALQVVRVVVLAVDEQDFLGAPGDEQVALRARRPGRRCAASRRP